MEWSVGFVLLTLFFGPTSAFPQKSFFFVRDRLDWLSARTHCRNYFVDLASVSDDSDLRTMSGLVDTHDQYVYVGFKREWQWSTSDSDDPREKLISFNKFERGEPNDESDCGMIQRSGEWRTQTCDTQWTFFCYDENFPDRFVKGNDTKYWGHSRTYCQTHHTDLARVRDEADNQRLVNLFDGTENGSWIGLTKRRWSWSDGSYPGFDPWVQPRSTPEREQTCAVLNVTAEPAGLVPWNCNDALPFFCYKFPQKKLVVKISMSVAESVVDSAADSVLELLQDKLKDRGVSEGLSLIWRKRPQKVPPDPEPEELHCPAAV